MDLHTTFRPFSPPLSAIKRIRARSQGLGEICPDLVSCVLVAEQSHDRQLKGKVYRIAVAAGLASGEMVANHDHHNRHAEENFFVAIEDAFDALEKAIIDCRTTGVPSFR